MPLKILVHRSVTDSEGNEMAEFYILKGTFLSELNL
jgi:hypothetical protein